MMRILDPTLRQEATAIALPRAARPRSLGGATIGLLANSKSNGMTLLDRIAERLRFQPCYHVVVGRGGNPGPAEFTGLRLPSHKVAEQHPPVDLRSLRLQSAL